MAGWGHERKETKTNLVPYRACYCESKHYNSSIVQCPCIFPGSKWLDAYVVTIISSQSGEQNAKFLLGPSRTSGKTSENMWSRKRHKFILHKIFSLQRFLRFLPSLLSLSLISFFFPAATVSLISFIHSPSRISWLYRDNGLGLSCNRVSPIWEWVSQGETSSVKEQKLTISDGLGAKAPD